MKATVGDRIIVRSVHVDEAVRDGEVVEVHGEDGAPPYLVRWSDSGHTGLIYPGPGTTVEHSEHQPASRP